MKLRLELEVSPSEAERVAPLLAAFKELSTTLSHQEATVTQPIQAPPSPLPATTKPKRPDEILLSASLSEQTPSSASAQLISQRFSQAEISESAIALISDAERAGGSTERAGLVISAVLACGEGAMKVFTQGFVGVAVRELMVPREYACDRREFYGFATGLVALTEIGHVSGEAVMRSVNRLLEKDTSWTAGITLFCLLLECDRVSGDAEAVRERLKEIATVEAFRYDVGYIDSITGWKLGEVR